MLLRLLSSAAAMSRPPGRRTVPVHRRFVMHRQRHSLLRDGRCCSRGCKLVGLQHATSAGDPEHQTATPAAASTLLSAVYKSTTPPYNQRYVQDLHFIVRRDFRAAHISTHLESSTPPRLLNGAPQPRLCQSECRFFRIHRSPSTSISLDAGPPLNPSPPCRLATSMLLSS